MELSEDDTGDLITSVVNPPIVIVEIDQSNQNASIQSFSGILAYEVTNTDDTETGKRLIDLTNLDRPSKKKKQNCKEKLLYMFTDIVKLNSWVQDDASKFLEDGHVHCLICSKTIKICSNFKYNEDYDLESYTNNAGNLSKHMDTSEHKT
jgi:hypothetical protein